MMQYKDNDTSVYGLRHLLYTVFEIEPGLVNDRVHYTSLDGKSAVSYGECGSWQIQPLEHRSVKETK